MILTAVLLGLIFILVGCAKLFRFNFQTEKWEEYGYPQWLMSVTGGIEVICGIIFLLANWFPNLAFLASFVIAVILLIAIYTRLVRLKQSWTRILLHVILLIVVILFMFGL